MSFERRLPSSERSFLGRRVHVKNSWRVLRVPIGKSGIHFTQWTVVSTRPFLGKTTRALTRSVLTMPRTVGCATSVKYAVFTTAYQPNQSRQVARPEERTVFQSAPKGRGSASPGRRPREPCRDTNEIGPTGQRFPLQSQTQTTEIVCQRKRLARWAERCSALAHDSPGRCPGLGEPKAFGPGNIRCFTEENWHTTKPL